MSMDDPEDGEIPVLEFVLCDGHSKFSVGDAGTLKELPGASATTCGMSGANCNQYSGRGSYLHPCRPTSETYIKAIKSHILKTKPIFFSLSTFKNVYT